MSDQLGHCSVVWFKRDLRLRDHAPLAAAIASGHPVLMVYLFEPELMGQSDWSLRHGQFVHQSITDRAFETLERPQAPELLEAWKQGKTGVPLVDACMRCLRETGYLNFRSGR